VAWVVMPDELKPVTINDVSSPVPMNPSSSTITGAAIYYNRISITALDMKAKAIGKADQRGLFTGFVKLHVLHHACREPIFGLGMIEELARHGYRLSPGTLYPIVHGLETEGLLRSKRQQVNGKIRRVYSATPHGRKALEAAKQRVHELFGELFEE
jgi:PadR family transcriptional regulator PadR